MGLLRLSVTGGWCRCVEEGKEPVRENHGGEVLIVGQHVRKPHAANECEDAVLPTPPQRHVVNSGEDHIADESSSIKVDSVG